MQNKNLQITCPSCGHEFSPEAALEKHIRAHIDKEYTDKSAAEIRNAELRARAAAETEFQAKINLLEMEAVAKSKKLRELEGQSLAVLSKEKELSQRIENTDLEIKRRLLEGTEKIRMEAEKFALEKVSLNFREKEAALRQQQESMEVFIKKEALLQVEKAREEEKMKYAELLKVHEDQKHLLDVMQRKAEQGSMQLQGEVQELAIEAFLKNTFPKDTVEEISKGVRGADCVHLVKDPLGNECGKILYESKRTKSFNKEWISKIKEDVRLKQASLGVIVTEAMPAEMTRFGQIDGIWICSFPEFKSVSALLRYSLLRIGEVLAAQENKGDKMQLLYEYLTGNEFRQRVEAISEAFHQMSTDLNKERAQTEANFGKREKQLQKVLISTMALYGEVRGIAGNGVQIISTLEPDGNSPQLREAV